MVIEAEKDLEKEQVDMKEAAKLPQESDFQGWTLQEAKMGITIKHSVGEGSQFAAYLANQYQQ